ncbi:MAG: hypothetical protein H8E36_15280 [Rhodospirillaceae bacterium]|nr:hypothetical protein [Rhodospirillaceae bacterium]MBL6929892.1 hypothetical protein [Rhodospirillales bacterium]MBL6941612.1 hypothetical protein [Rhodospirillales bacterium]
MTDTKNGEYLGRTDEERRDEDDRRKGKDPKIKKLFNDYGVKEDRQNEDRRTNATRRDD